jgi:alanine dehydrogenase
LMCGTGTQARRHLLALRLTRPGLRLIRVWSRDPAKAAAFCAGFASPEGCPVVPTEDLASAARSSGIIVTCTSSRSAFLMKDHVAPRAFVAAVGADSPEKQELDPALTASARVVVDLREQCEKVGELHHAIKAGLWPKGSACVTLGEVAASGVANLPASGVTVFDSTGTALQDAAAARVVYERALARGVGRRINFLE